MKTLLAFFLAISLYGCATPMIKDMTFSCGKTREEIMSAFTALTIREAMTIKISDVNIGYCRAEMAPISTLYGVTFTYAWQIQIDKAGMVTATATNTQNNGRITYYDDTDVSDKSIQWYWNVRNGLQELCGSDIKFNSRKMY